MKPSLIWKVLPFLGVAMATTPAWAGWTGGFEYDGKDVSGPVTQPWVDNDNGTQHGIGSNIPKPGDKQDGVSSGHYKLVLKLPVSEQLPPTIGIMFRQLARGTGGRDDVTYSGSYSVTPEPGGTPGTITLSTKVTMPDGTPYTDTEHMSLSRGKYSYTSGGWGPLGLVTVSTQNATVENGFYVVRYTLPLVEAKFSATQGNYIFNYDGFTPGSDSTYAEVGVDAQAFFDSRTLWLTRGSSSPKIKGDPGVTIDEAHDEWRELDKNGLWVTHGQSRWSYTNRTSDGPPNMSGNPMYSDKSLPNTQVVGAQLGGSWSSYSLLQGVWSNPDPHDFFPPGTTGQPASQTHVETLPDGGALKDDVGIRPSPAMPGVPEPQGWYGTPSKGQNPVTVTYTLTDKGPTPATATAKYILQLHDEWENVAPDSAYSWQEAGTGTSHPGESLQWWNQQLHYNGPQLTTADADASWDVTADTKLSTKLSTTFALDFNLADWVKIGGSAEATAEASIDATFKASAPKPSAIFAVAPGDTFQPIVKYQVKTAHWLVDHFLLSGFDPNPDRSFGRVADSKWPQTGDISVAQWVPYWLQIGVGLGPPTTGVPYPAPNP